MTADHKLTLPGVLTQRIYYGAAPPYGVALSEDAERTAGNQEGGHGIEGQARTSDERDGRP